MFVVWVVTDCQFKFSHCVIVVPSHEVGIAEIVMGVGVGFVHFEGLLVDRDRFVETALLKRDSESTVATYTLQPGETRAINLETMPQGGSNYPVRLVVRPK